MNVIDIWSPKWSTKEVLIKPYQVKDGVNKIVFTKCDYPNLLIDGRDIRSYPMASHGAIGAYAVPLRAFKRERSNQLSLIEPKALMEE